MNDFTSQRGLVQLIVCFNMATHKGVLHVIWCCIKTKCILSADLHQGKSGPDPESKSGIRIQISDLDDFQNLMGTKIHLR